MPTRDDTPLGSPCWIDVFTSDVDATQAFYSSLFGWTVEPGDPQFGGYFNFSKDGRLVAGGMANDGANGTPDAWSIYLAVTDAAATVEAAQANGASVIAPAMAVGDLGHMAVLTDPGQAVVGIWQPGVHRGVGLSNEPNTLNYCELHTRAYDAALKFYEEVFGWDTHTMSDEPEFRYTTVGYGETAPAGVMDATGFLPEGVPSSWNIYFNVEDAAATQDRIVELGGSLIQKAEETPYGILVTAADPTGAVFKLQQP